MKRRYRVKVRRAFWIKRNYFFPQEKFGWLPFWFNFDDMEGDDVFFSTADEAWDWIAIVQEKRNKN